MPSAPEPVSLPRRYGKYELLERIGEGGMAEAYKARLPGAAGFEKTVVIKRILPHLAESSRFVKMFVNEAKLAAQIQHQNVVQVFELGELSPSGELYMAMEYVHGLDLRAILELAAQKVLRIPIWFSAHALHQVLNGLAHAHELIDEAGEPLSIIHRDVTPSNVFVSVLGEVKLADFGVAKAIGSMEPEATDTTLRGQLKGKISYAPPEQIHGEVLDARADVFSAGVVLWECLTQRRLFGGRADFETMLAICEEPRTPPSAFNPSVPPELDAIVLHALEKDREDRFETARAFAAELGVVVQQLRPRLLPTDVRHVLEVLRGKKPVHPILGADLPGLDDGRAEDPVPLLRRRKASSAPPQGRSEGARDEESGERPSAPSSRLGPADGARSVPPEESRSRPLDSRSLPPDPSRAVPPDPSRAAPPDPRRTLPSDPSRAVPPDPSRAVPPDPSRAVPATALSGRPSPAPAQPSRAASQLSSRPAPAPLASQWPAPQPSSRPAPAPLASQRPAPARPSSADRPALGARDEAAEHEEALAREIAAWEARVAQDTAGWDARAARDATARFAQHTAARVAYEQDSVWMPEPPPGIAEDLRMATPLPLAPPPRRVTSTPATPAPDAIIPGLTPPSALSGGPVYAAPLPRASTPAAGGPLPIPPAASTGRGRGGTDDLPRWEPEADAAHAGSSPYFGANPFFARTTDGSTRGPLDYLAFSRLLETKEARDAVVSADGDTWMPVTTFATLAGLEMLFRERPRLKRVAAVGTLEDTSLIALFAKLALAGTTGRLVLMTGASATARREVEIVRGAPSEVWTDRPDLQLPALVVRRELLPRDRIPELVHRCLRDRVPLDEALRGLTNASGRYRPILMRDRLVEVLRWRQGKFALDAVPIEGPPFAASLLASLVDLVARAWTESELTSRLDPVIGARLTPGPDFGTIVPALELSKQVEAQLDKLVDGKSLSAVSRRAASVPVLALGLVMLETGALKPR